MRALALAGLLGVASLATAASAITGPWQARVTIFARPTTADWTQGVTLFGAVDNGRAGEKITIQARDCGSGLFRALAEATTQGGGGWSIQTGLPITTTLRAVWQGSASGQVTVRERLGVLLDRRGPGDTFRVGVTAKRSFWRKKVDIQRRERGGWKTVWSIALTDTAPAGVFSYASARFRLRVPKGSLLRAVVPRSQAGPCYLPSVSRTVRA